MFRLMRKAQSTAEYAIVVGLVIAAAVAMQVYVKRGLQAKVKAGVDYVDTDASTVLGSTAQNQYEPYYMGSTFTSSRNASDTENAGEGGVIDRTTNEISSRTGNQTIANVQ
ncbi:MAG: hypothetical protein NTW13_04975 [Candidatus Omnitrophica bacterium]|nr:hypothetical protein [Candidatus Omnitrophota bacterium]